MNGRPFNFRLQRILAMRRLAEQEAAITLAVSQTDASHAQAACDRLAAEGAEARAAMVPDVGRTQKISALRPVSFIIDAIDSRSSHATEVLVVAERNVHMNQDRLGERIKGRRVLERLRQQHHESWVADEGRLEREFMDGIARSQPANVTGTDSSTDDGP